MHKVFAVDFLLILSYCKAASSETHDKPAHGFDLAAPARRLPPCNCHGCPVVHPDHDLYTWDETNSRTEGMWSCGQHAGCVSMHCNIDGPACYDTCTNGSCERFLCPVGYTVTKEVRCSGRACSVSDCCGTTTRSSPSTATAGRSLAGIIQDVTGDDSAVIIVAVVVGVIVLCILACAVHAFRIWQRRRSYPVPSRGPLPDVIPRCVPTSALELPKYWKNKDIDATFQDWERVPPEVQATIQDMMANSFKPVQTSDRKGRMPTRLNMVGVHRIENGALWRKYAEKRYRVMSKHPHRCTEIAKTAGSKLRTDTEGTAMNGRLQKDINEVYLWHGTSPAGATGICKEGFQLTLAGTGAGIMYGGGVYLAECSSKSDEYAQDDTTGPYKGVYCLLLCRVILGEVLKMTAGGSETHTGIKALIDSGKYDSVLGDREASVDTYKEFVVYAGDQAYPEYLILYQRVHKEWQQ